MSLAVTRDPHRTLAAHSPAPGNTAVVATIAGPVAVVDSCCIDEADLKRAFALDALVLEVREPPTLRRPAEERRQALGRDEWMPASDMAVASAAPTRSTASLGQAYLEARKFMEVCAAYPAWLRSMAAGPYSRSY